MHKHIFYLLFLVLLCVPGHAQEIEIPDPNLRNAIRETLSLPDGAPITQADMRQLTGLTASDRQITDLTGLEYAANLTNLVLGSNYISDLAPLAKSTKLELLWLWNNPLSDLSPLADLTHLENVDLAGCEIANITPLSNLTQLTRLILRHNRITDLTPLAELIELEDLLLWSNPCSDLNPLAGLTNLKSADLSECQISDITPLSNFTQVTTLKLSDNRIVDITPLANLTQLTLLRLNNNRIEDISPLANLTKLEVLHLDRNRITDIVPLVNLVLLNELRINDNEVVNVMPLASLEQLIELRLHNNQIEDISPLSNLINLTHLEIQNNRIIEIAPLANLTNLEYLDTDNNPIFDPDSPPVEIPDPNLRQAVRDALNLPHGIPITQAGMGQLTGLDAGHRRIADLTGLEHATNLDRLDISFNPVFDLTPLANLMRLRYLDAAYCNISNLTPLTNLSQLTWLGLENNIFTDIKLLANLAQLTVLQLSRNELSDITPLANLTQLVELQLDNNKISDITPLSNLRQLESLDVRINAITDLSPVDSLSLIHFEYDQYCDMAPLPLEPRLSNRTYPSVFGGDWLFGYDSRIDLLYGGALGMYWRPDGKLAGNLEDVIQRRDELIARNPNMVFLVLINWAHDKLHNYIEDWPYWLRDTDGNIIIEDNRNPKNPNVYIDFTQLGAQDIIVQKAVDVSTCGLFDGIVFDGWFDDRGVRPHLSNLEQEMHAKIAILQRIRARTRPNFLIQVNSNRSKIPLTGPYINGLSMETKIPISFFHDPEWLHHALLKTESTLLWAEETLREPRINGVAGETLPLPEAADSPENLRWVRALTSLSLTHADGYALYQDLAEIDGGTWYDFLDTDLGYPVGDTEQLYEDRPGLFIREFTNGWAVYNRSGETQKIALPELATGVASRVKGTTHTLPNYDGEMYLRVKPVNPADVNAEPIDAVPGAALLLDASNNPGTTAHWVNLGTAGGRLQASGIRARVEEGEIEIPSIGFSGRRRYYTATGTGQTFGGPVHLNPQLYVGNWTLEFLCKRNGDSFSLEHHFAGFQNSPREGLQGIRLGLLLDAQELDMSIHAGGFKQPTRALNIFLAENVWTWVTIVSMNGESIIAYQDGVEVSRHPGVHFDSNLPLDDISIGSFSYDERRRNFNGSFSIVRVYDRALRPDEVLQNIGATVIPMSNPADVNGDGVVNILDLVLVAQAFGKDSLEGDVNGDGVVNVFDLVQVAGAIGGGGAAPSAYSPELSIISAADVERWLAQAQGLGVGDANFQRGIRFLQQLLEALTPKETTLLPNYPNPFNPETWIPYRLAQEAEVAITIYDTKGALVRQLALGNQSAGYYAERGKAAYWDGLNEDGETVASGIYIYQFRAEDYAASRRMVIVK